jgi:hypothetical protein
MTSTLCRPAYRSACDYSPPTMDFASWVQTQMSSGSDWLKIFKCTRDGAYNSGSDRSA